MPLVIMLHGAGGTASAAIREMGWTEKADSEGFLIVFTEGSRPDPTKPPKFGPNSQTWNDGSGRFDSGEKNAPDVAFINAVIDDISMKFPVDAKRIYATGFSNGASMAFRVGVELSERIAGVAPVSGAFWLEEPKAARPVSLLYIVGNADPLNPMEGGVPKMATGSGFKGSAEKVKPPVRENLSKWIKMIDCKPDGLRVGGSPEGVTTTAFSGGRNGAEVVFTIVEGQGHNWPGGKIALPEWMVGKATQHLRATDAIWEFFAKHPKSE